MKAVQAGIFPSYVLHFKEFEFTFSCYTQLQYYLLILLGLVFSCRLRAGGEGNDRGWDGWMASRSQWTWVWVDSSSWWWTGRPGMLRFMGSQRVRHDWATELNWTEAIIALKGGFPCGSVVKNPPANAGDRFDPWVSLSVFFCFLFFLLRNSYFI